MLQLRGISKTFSRGTIDEIEALSAINLDINAEDFITIIGSNGAGKTTLLNIVAGVYPPEKGGQIIVAGVDTAALSEYQRAQYVSRVYQDPQTGTAANMTIEENLSMAMMRGRSRGLRLATNKRRREQMRSALAQLELGLENRLSASVGTLSGGQRQALALVMATISNPTILLLDEHIATLDPKTAQTVLDLSDMIVRRDRMTAMMVTHNMDVALHYGNRLIMMHKGRVVVDIGEADKKALTINDLITAFERAAGEQFKDDSILLRA
ncbi:MAG: ATP-binding cassette domain-containing protein [Chloroflexota bacterium]|nr:ATP-binding cassette domain-containing protein [Chloroflexota bacterium]